MPELNITQLSICGPYILLHTSLPWSELFTLEPDALDCQHDIDFDPDMLTDDGTSTG
jgi:hypothetical protein